MDKVKHGSICYPSPVTPPIIAQGASMTQEVVYYLKDGAYKGLKEHLELLGVSKKTHSTIRGCTRPMSGQTLRNGNFVPSLYSPEVFPCGTLNLYWEKYVCSRMHAASRKRRRVREKGHSPDNAPSASAEPDDETLTCRFSATATVTWPNPTQCTLTYPIEHKCPFPERKPTPSDGVATLPEGVKTILRQLEREGHSATGAYSMVTLSSHFLRKSVPEIEDAPERLSIEPEGMSIPPGHYYVLQTACAADILKMPFEERESISQRAVSIYVGSLKRKKRKISDPPAAMPSPAVPTLIPAAVPAASAARKSILP
jgi:hypothetical protein